MRCSIIACASAALVGLAAASPAIAQQDWMQDRQQRQQQRQQDQRQQDQRQRTHVQNFRGELLGVRQIQLQGENEDHVIAKIRLENGKTVVADLGTVSELKKKKARLSKGQTFDATGAAGRIDGMPVVVVYDFTSEGKTTNISHQSRQRSRMDRDHRDARQRPGPRQQQARIDGQLQDVRTITVQGDQGQRDKHVVGKIRLQDGRTAVVDFGKKSELQRQQAQMQRGQQVRGHAAGGRIDAVPVLVVYDFTLDQEGRRYTTSADRQRRQDQQQRADRQRRQPQRDRMARRGLPRMDEVVLTGDVVSLRDVTIKGHDRDHRLIKVKTEAGRIYVVDLGNADVRSKLDLSKGDRVIVAGRAARVGGRPVVLASQFAEMIDVDWSWRQMQRHRRQLQQDRQEEE